MLDIRYIRDNADLVAKKSKQKGYDVDIPKLLELDKARRELLADIETVRAQRNDLATAAKGQKPSQADIKKGKDLKDKLTNLEAGLKNAEVEYEQLLKTVPNMPCDDVPVGKSEDDNVVARERGDKPKFSFEPKTHWQIAEDRGLIDKERAAKVAGARFAYIMGDLVRLQFALIQFVINTLSDEKVLKEIIDKNHLKVSPKPFTPVLPPLMIKTPVYDAMDRLEPRDDRYKVGAEEDDLWLQGSAEHTLGPMYKDEVIAAANLPIRYLGYATSFRREAGTYGKDTEGIIRMHQFDKLEMEVFSMPSDGLSEHLLLVAIQEYLMQQLGLPYRVLQKCTADIGKPNARGIDLEVWLPGANRWMETHTADFMTDYQARRLNTRTKNANGESEFVHTNDATAFALGRTMVGIIENYQTAEGKVKIPEVLQKYLGKTTEI